MDRIFTPGAAAAALDKYQSAGADLAYIVHILV